MRLNSKLIIIFISIVILAIALVTLRMIIPYEKEYFKKAGITGTFYYEDILSSKGIPISEEIVKEEGDYTWLVVNYDGYALDFYKHKDVEKNKAFLFSVVITDPNYRIGIFKIGVGSSKKQVLRAFIGKTSIKGSNGELAYIDNNRLDRVCFEFDEEEKIKRIIISRSGY